jgi:hypothetical protein
MMRAISAVVGVALVAAAPAPVTQEAWLQTRMDRIVEAAGFDRGVVRTVLVTDRQLEIDGQGVTIAVPRGLVANAPSAQAVDGILAMLLSYRQESVLRRDGASIGDLAALATLLAATGGISEDKSTKVIPLGDGVRPSASALAGRSKAQRGARWMEAAGSCTPALTGYLRTLAQGSIEDGATVPARRLLADMGALAYPTTQPCVAEKDDGFSTVRGQLVAPS